MPCHFYTAKFVRCTHNARAGSDYCGVHQAKAERLGPRPMDTACHCVRFIDGADQWCGGARAEGEDVCTWHAQRKENRAERERAETERVLMEARELDGYLNDPRALNWQEVTRECRRRMNLPQEHAEHIFGRSAEAIARRFFIRTSDLPWHVFTDFWVNLWREERGLPPMAPDVPIVVPWMGEEIPQVAPQPQPQGQMARLARDTQNVHTAHVAKQTNGNLELLLEAAPFEGQDTLHSLTAWWLNQSFEDYWRVMEDVRFWYTKRTCKASNDRLYQRVLDGLLVKILQAPHEVFDELVKRLWEECEEAVGMCCEGHLARLANVLVGFDEAFRPPVPVGEVLQQKMASIAALKVSTKHKLQRAVELMDELKIPVADRAPWLEALE